MEILLARAIIFVSCVVLYLWFIGFYTAGYVTCMLSKFAWSAAHAKRR